MLRLRTYGGLTLEHDGAPCTGAATQRRRLALLTLLAAGPDVGTSRDRITAFLWPDADPARARHSLDDALSALRRDLGATLFLGIATLRLNPDVIESDVAERTAALRRGDLERAVTLHAGPFLDGFGVPRADGFERWVEEERGRQRVEQTRALDALAAGATARGDSAGAARWLSARVGLDPLDTVATLRLLDALAAAGNRAEALRLARVHEALVHEELDSTPGPEWADAVGRLRRGLATPPAAPVVTSPATPLPAPATAAGLRRESPPDGPDPRAPAEDSSAGSSVADAPSADLVHASAVPEHAAVGPGAGVWRARGARRVAMIPSVALAGVLLAGAVWSLARREDERPNAAAAGTARVLVVPFENATGDSMLAPLGRMAGDWVAQGLAGVPGVTAITDPDLASGADATGLRRAAARNAAGTVVSGTYYESGDSIRLQVRVTDVAGWELRPGVSPVSAPRSVPTALLEPLRQRVMVVLAATHDPRYSAFTVGMLPPTYDAYEQYLAGTAVFEQGRWEDALPYYARAAALDSTYVQPVIAAADAELNLGQDASADTLVRRLEQRRAALSPADQGNVDRLRAEIDGDRMGALEGARASAAAAPGAQLPRFLEAATALRAGRPREALAAAEPIASTFGRVRTAWTGGIYWSVVTAAHHVRAEYLVEREAAQTARAYHPDSPDVRALELRSLAALGRLDSLRLGVSELAAMPSTPGAASTTSLLVLVAKELDAHGHPEDARGALREAVAVANARPLAERRTPAARFELAEALYLQGEYTAAAPLFTALASERPDDPRYLGYVGLVAARRGRRAEADRADARLRALRRAYDRGQTAFARARLAAAMRDTAAALSLLRQARAEGLPYGTGLHIDGELAPLLQADPAFGALIAPRG